MQRPFRRNVGVLGLGIIGRRIADYLRHRGLSVFVWNRTPRPVPNFVGSPAELAQTCNYLQIFVSDDDALMRMIQTVAPSLTSRHVVIPHATVSPKTMREAAALVQRRGARLLEAPFTGSKLAAEKGELVYYAGGDEQTLAEVRPLLQASSKSILHVGGIGDASVIKVATNLITAASVQAAAEGLALVARAGIPLQTFVDAMKQNAANSATLDLKLPRMIAGDFEPHFSVKHMLKDMEIATRLGSDFDLDLNLTAAARDRLVREMRGDGADQDYSAVLRSYLPSLGTTPGDEKSGAPRPPQRAEAASASVAAPAIAAAPVSEATPPAQSAPPAAAEAAFTPDPVVEAAPHPAVEAPPPIPEPEAASIAPATPPEEQQTEEQDFLAAQMAELESAGVSKPAEPERAEMTPFAEYVPELTEPLEHAPVQSSDNGLVEEAHAFEIEEIDEVAESHEVEPAEPELEPEAEAEAPSAAQPLETTMPVQEDVALPEVETTPAAEEEVAVEEVLPEEEPEPVKLARPIANPLRPAPPDDTENAEQKRGFLSRLLGRTADY